MSTMTDENLAQGQADGYRQTLENLWGCADEGEMYEDQEPLEYLSEMPLEIVWEMGEPFTIVLGTGGPHTEIVGGGRQGGYELHSYWGGSHGIARSEAITRTGEYFRELVEQS